MEKIAPNNQLPATHFIEVWQRCNTKRPERYTEKDVYNISDLEQHLDETTIVTDCGGIDTIAIFRIRQNKLPTNHKF